MNPDCLAFARLSLKNIGYHTFGKPGELTRIHRFMVGSKNFVEKLAYFDLYLGVLAPQGTGVQVGLLWCS